MSMTNNGLSKLTEECGELQQVIGKLLQYPHLQKDFINELPIKPNHLHPDGTHLRTRLEKEMGDVLAAMQFVFSKLELDLDLIMGQAHNKFSLFEVWDMEK